MALLATSRMFRDGPLGLELGGELPRLEMAYETWGTLAPDADNALLICHGYTGNPHAAGWWPGLLGPGKAIDTDRWFDVRGDQQRVRVFRTHRRLARLG